MLGYITGFKQISNKDLNDFLFGEDKELSFFGKLFSGEKYKNIVETPVLQGFETKYVGFSNLEH